MIWVSICYVAHARVNALQPNMFQDTIAPIGSKSGAHVQRKVSHIFPRHTWRQMNIVIARDGFRTLANVVLVDLTHIDLV